MTVFKLSRYYCQGVISVAMLRKKPVDNDFFLGVAEEQIKNKVGMCILNASIDVQKFVFDSYAMVRAQTQTEVYKKLIKGVPGYPYFGIMVELIFTNNESWNKIGTNRKIEIIKVLNLSNDRLGRTILEVKVEGFNKNLALKCIECVVGDVGAGKVKTIVDKEIIAYDELPVSLRGIFVQKHAHGRLWFDSSSYEVILMDKMALSLFEGINGVRYKKENPEHFIWCAKAFELLHKIHVEGYSHGDAHLGNQMWSSWTDFSGPGNGELKFIDPERMVNLKNEKNEIKNLLKLNDIGMMFFINPLLLNGLRKYVDPYELDLIGLHNRLKEIKKLTRSPSAEGFVFFDDLLPYDKSFLIANAGSSSDLLRIEKKIETVDRNQYRKLQDGSFSSKLDAFTLQLSNPLYLTKVLLYIVAVLDNLAARNPISTVEKSIPVSIHRNTNPFRPILPEPGAVGDQKMDQRQLMTPPTPVSAHSEHTNFTTPAQSPPIQTPPIPQRRRVPVVGTYPLMYRGANVQALENAKSIIDVYYTLGRDSEKPISLLCSPTGRSTSNMMRTFDGKIRRKLFSNKKQMEMRNDHSDAYFSFDDGTNTLIIWKRVIGPGNTETFEVVDNVPFGIFHQHWR